MSILIQEVMSGSYIVKDDLGGHIIGYCASPPPNPFIPHPCLFSDKRHHFTHSC